MTERERPGHVTLTIEVPLEVADWLASSGEQLAQVAALAAAKARRASTAIQLDRQWRLEQRKAELWNLGRIGYRLFRRFNGGRNIGQRVELVREVALHLGCNAHALKLSMVRFKRHLEARLSKRRNREMSRLCAAGYSNSNIAARYGVHPNTVVRCLREHKAVAMAYARELPGTSNTLKGNNKGILPGKSPGASLAISWEALKKAGRRT